MALKLIHDRFLKIVNALFLVLAILLLVGKPAIAAGKDPGFALDIKGTDIDSLLKLKITGASKTEEPLREAAAAVFVLTNEEIHRSGATSIPEALRLVPGVAVARINANQWTVSMRGFGSNSINKLLVLIDGRAIYDPLFSGVFWETKDIMLEDVDRIEVIRGPGGAVWGANAVDGVINIITKSAKDTQGGLVTGGMGTEERGFSSARYGFQMGENSFGRVYGKYFDRDSGARVGGADDISHMTQAGFRTDTAIDSDNSVTFKGDYNDGKEGNYNNTIAPPFTNSEGYILGNWTSKVSADSRYTLQIYFDHTHFDKPLVLGENRNTFDIDLKHEYAITKKNTLIWGGGFRATHDDISASQLLTLDPIKKTDNLYNIFFEDRAQLTPRTQLTFGSKFEQNDYTGFEYAPTARISWSIDDKNLVWSAVSRAIRPPSRLESDFQIMIPPNIHFFGNRELKSETLVAYELGYRVQPFEDFSIDLASFYNDYDYLIDTEGFSYGNKARGHTVGLEGALSWQPVSWWKLTTSCTVEDVSLILKSGSLNSPADVERVNKNLPNNQVSVGSRIDLGHNFQFDTNLRYVDSIPAQSLSSYLVGDIRLGYKPSKNLELEIIGQNLFDGSHFERGGTSATQTQEGIYGRVTWKF